jgi:hypothetical protein
MAQISEQNARRQDLVHPARAFCFEIEANLTSGEFCPFCLWRHWQVCA